MSLQKLPSEETTILASAASLGIALSGAWLYPPLGLLSMASTAYAALPIFKNAYSALRNEHRPNQAVTNSAVVLSCLATQHFVAAAMTVGLLHIGDKLFKRYETAQAAQIDQLAPQTTPVWVRVAGDEVPMEITALKAGDEILLEPGEVCAVAGTITEGYASLEQADAKDGAHPVLGQVGTPITAGAHILAGKICVQVEQSESAQMVAINRSSQPLPATLCAETDSPADTMALPLLALSALSIPLLGPAGAAALLNASGSGNLKHLFQLHNFTTLEQALAYDIVLKQATALHSLKQVNAFVFDLAALYEPTPVLEEIYTYQNVSTNEVLTYALASARALMHPLLNVLEPEAQARRLPLSLDEVQVMPNANQDFQAWVDRKLVRIGEPVDLARKAVKLPSDVADFDALCHQRGHQMLLVVVDGQCLGALELSRHTRPEAQAVLQHLHEQALALYAISNANLPVAPALLESWKLAQVFDERHWPHRADIIAHLQNQGKTVCYIGNGITQRQTMRQADVSVSVAGTAGLAQDAAQIVLLNSDLTALTKLGALTRETDVRFKTNLLTTFLPNAVCVGGIVLGGWGLGASITANALNLLLGLRQYSNRQTA
ncbi:MAG: HAD family hydrolase [Caldilineaceae bacterium]